jgi:hypothetical protein
MRSRSSETGCGFPHSTNSSIARNQPMPLSSGDRSPRILRYPVLRLRQAQPIRKIIVVPEAAQGPIASIIAG